MPVSINMPQPKQNDALEKIAQAVQIAGGIYNLVKTDPNEEIARSLKKQQIQEAQDKVDLTKELNDPNSKTSIFQSQVAQRAGIPGVTPGVTTAKQIQELGPIAQIIATQPNKILQNQSTQLEIQKKKQELAQGAKPTSEQGNAALFGNRMTQAENVFSDLGDNGFDPTSIATTAQGYLPEAAKPEDLKRYEQAKRNFLTATLRKESGAAISNGELETGNKQYFPAVGDTPAVLEQKRQNRQLAIDGMKVESGQFYDKVAEKNKADSKQGQGITLPKGKPAPNGATKVIQNGHEYNWNPQTGNYE